MTVVLMAMRDAGQAARWRDELRAGQRCEVPAPVQTFAELRRLLTRHTPALVLADLRLPDGELTPLVQSMRNGGRLQQVPVLAATHDEQDPLLLDALQAGADSFCHISALRPGRLLDLVDDTLAGGAVIAPWIARRLLEHFGAAVHSLKAAAVEELVNPLSLSPTERQLLRQLSAGLSLNDLAAVEGVTARTLTARVRAIYRKMQWALRAGDLSLA